MEGIFTKIEKPAANQRTLKDAAFQKSLNRMVPAAATFAGAAATAVENK